MTPLPEPHIDRTEEPILTQIDGYAPKRERWPGLLAVAVLVAAAVGGVVVTGKEEAKQQTGASADRAAQPASPQAPNAPNAPNASPSDDTRVARKPH